MIVSQSDPTSQARLEVDDGDLTAALTVTAPRPTGGTVRLAEKWFMLGKPADTIRLGGRLGGRAIALSTPAG